MVKRNIDPKTPPPLPPRQPAVATDTYPRIGPPPSPSSPNASHAGTSIIHYTVTSSPPPTFNPYPCFSILLRISPLRSVLTSKATGKNCGR